MFQWYSLPPRVLQTLAWLPTRLLLNFFCHFEVRGRKNLAGLTNAIFAPNHANELDPIVLTAALSPFGRFAPMYYVSDAVENFQKKDFGWRRHLYKGWFFKSWGSHPVATGLKNYEKALVPHVKIIKNGGSLCIFPEGYITRDGKLREARGGVVFLSTHTGTPVVPVAISETFKLNPSDFFKRKRHVVLEFGKPIYPQALIEDEKKHIFEHYRVSASFVLERIFDLLEKHKVGGYRVGLGIRVTYATIRFVLGPIIRLIWVKEVKGMENFPLQGPVILAANHESYFDFITCIAISPRNIYYLAAEKFFRHPAWRILMKLTGQIEVDRENKERRSHVDKVVYDLLSRGCVVGIFPEGTRAGDPEIMLKGYPGVVRYGYASGAPILPVGIKGTYRVMSRFDKKPHFKKIIEINVGNPIFLGNPLEGEPSEEKIEKTLYNLMGTLAVLSGKKYPYSKEDGK